ncbi:MAG: hypothetical protein CLLPBCKN_000396 [Chroococcidiopsis cubana SAG 39.79]|jgi:hypothetical protein|nr:hypothetical protein [Chroococcidiopsis cubana SAG 39.79]
MFFEAKIVREFAKRAGMRNVKASLQWLRYARASRKDNSF